MGSGADKTTSERGGVILFLVLAFAVVAVGLVAHVVAKNFSPIAGAVFFVSMLAWGLAGFVYLRAEQEEDEPIDPRPAVRRATQNRYPQTNQAADDSAPRPAVTGQSTSENDEAKPAPPKPTGFKPVAPKPKGGAEDLPVPAPPPVVTKEERFEQFQQSDFRESIAAGVNEFTTLVESTKHKMGHYQNVMGKRMHKSTGTEHRSLISLRKLVEILEERLDQLKHQLEAFENGSASREEVFKLLYDDLVVPHDSVNALPGEKPLPPVPREQWIQAIDLLARQVARKPSFIQLLRSEILSSGKER